MLPLSAARCMPLVALLALAGASRISETQSAVGEQQVDSSQQHNSGSLTFQRDSAEQQWRPISKVTKLAAFLLLLDPTAAFRAPIRNVHPPTAGSTAKGLHQHRRNTTLHMSEMDDETKRALRMSEMDDETKRALRMSDAPQDDKADEETYRVNMGYRDPTKLVFRQLRYFFGRVTVGLGPGFKPLDIELKPSWPDDTSGLSTVKVALPMGLVFEESPTVPGRFEVIEVGEGSNAEKAGIKTGDLIRATTAMAVNKLKQANTNIAYVATGGGVMPNSQRAFFDADDQPFENLMKALTSNSPQKGGPGEATLVIERNNPFSEDSGDE